MAVPLAGVIFLAVLQISQMVTSIGHWAEQTDFTALAQRLLDSVPTVLARVPFLDITLTPGLGAAGGHQGRPERGQVALRLRARLGGRHRVDGDGAILFLYVFIALLTNGGKVRRSVPRPESVGREGLRHLPRPRWARWCPRTVKGQFIIAVCQGVAGAMSIYIAGLHDGFFMFVIFLTALSFIPLGSGIVTIPFGIGMAVFGNVCGRHLRHRVPPRRGDEHRQLAAPVPGAARGAHSTRR